MSRRALLIGTAAGGAVAAAGLRRATPQASISGEASPVVDASRDEPRTHEFTLTAGELDWEIMPGVTTRMWGYNGQVPGPELRVREGDLVRVTLRNTLPVPTTIHWHGVHTRPEMDGPAGLNQEAVAPGDEFTYEFIAKPGGSRWYHSHADPQLQVPMGLYGPLIIEPRIPARSYSYDREYILMLGEWDSELTPEVAAGTAQRGPKDKMMRGGELGADMFLINGRAHGAIPPIVLKEHDRVLLRMINAGHLPHPIHMHGHSFKIVATDGNPVPEGMEWIKDTVLIGPAERYDLEFEGNNPGVWMFHCHIEHHMANGMMTVIQYEGHQPTGPAADFYAGDMSMEPHTGHESHGASNHSSDGTPEPAAPVSTQAMAQAGDAVVTMVDDRFEPVTLEIPAGTTVTWMNHGADWHSVAAYDGSFESEKLAPGQSFSFAYTEPGMFKYICKHHGLQGMIGAIIVS